VVYRLSMGINFDLLPRLLGSQLRLYGVFSTAVGYGNQHKQGARASDEPITDLSFGRY
jgi:hypothetical protein